MKIFPARSKWLMSALAVAAALQAGACHDRRPDLDPAMLTFKSDKFPYALAYDLNRWRIMAPAERQMVMIQADVVFADAPGSHFISVTVEPSTASLAEMRTQALIALQQKGPDLRVSSQTPVTVAGAPALSVRLEATFRELPLAYQLVFIQYGGYAYQIAHWSGVGKLADRQADFDRVVASFKPAAVAPPAPEAVHPVAYPSPSWGYIITLPDPEWRPSAGKLSAESDQQFQTAAGLAFVMVVAERLSIDVDQLSQRGIARLVESSHGRFRKGASSELAVDGVPARVVMGDTVVEGTRVRYAVLFASRGGIAYQVAAWAPEDLFVSRYETQFLAMFRSMQFL